MNTIKHILYICLILPVSSLLAMSSEQVLQVALKHELSDIMHIHRYIEKKFGDTKQQTNSSLYHYAKCEQVGILISSIKNKRNLSLLNAIKNKIPASIHGNIDASYQGMITTLEHMLQQHKARKNEAYKREMQFQARL